MKSSLEGCAENDVPLVNLICRHRVKTNMLALIENIDNDAGVWLGLRSDSFEVEPEGLALVYHDGRE